MHKKLFIEDLDLANKRVLIRVDYNVPLDEKQQITDDTRIQASLPTIQYALSKNAKVILMSHLGRPKGKKNPEFSLAPVAKHLSAVLKQDVLFAQDCIGPDVEKQVNQLKPRQILLLENLRFYAQEEEGEEVFSQALAKLGDVYINDAFGTSHRPHASIVGVTKYIKDSASGYLLQKEIEYLGKAIDNPERPFVAILGGAKVSDKIGVLKNLIHKADAIIIGGAMAYTFLAAKGIATGSSKIEKDKLDLASAVLAEVKAKNKEFLLPVDHVIAQSFKEDAGFQVTSNDSIPEGWMGLDIGPKSIQKFSQVIAKAKTVIWNGPMGVFEWQSFAKGTQAVAQAVANSKAISIVGGGDSVAAINQCGLNEKITHVSTGGGASLEMLEGIVLPGIEALSNTNKTLAGSRS